MHAGVYFADIHTYLLKTVTWLTELCVTSVVNKRVELLGQASGNTELHEAPLASETCSGVCLAAFSDLRIGY